MRGGALPLWMDPGAPGAPPAGLEAGGRPLSTLGRDFLLGSCFPGAAGTSESHRHGSGAERLLHVFKTLEMKPFKSVIRQLEFRLGGPAFRGEIQRSAGGAEVTPSGRGQPERGDTTGPPPPAGRLGFRSCGEPRAREGLPDVPREGHGWTTSFQWEAEGRCAQIFGRDDESSPAPSDITERQTGEVGARTRFGPRPRGAPGCCPRRGRRQAPAPHACENIYVYLHQHLNRCCSHRATFVCSSPPPRAS